MSAPSAARIAEIVANFRPRARPTSPRRLRRQQRRLALIEAESLEDHVQQWHMAWAPCGHEVHRFVVRMDHYCRTPVGDYGFRGSVGVNRCLNCTARELGVPFEAAVWRIEHSEDWRAAWLVVLPWRVVVPLWGFQ